MKPNSPDILIVTGEASGDLHAAKLVRALKNDQPDLSIDAMGGAELRAAGANILVDSSEMAVVGFVEILKIFNKIKDSFKVLKDHLNTHTPKLVILVDYAGFNLRIAKYAKQAGCKVLYYISPQVWASRPGRVKKIQRYVDKLAVIFPFEVDFYRQHHVAAEFVGHPLAQEQIDSITPIPKDTSAPLIALLPGSRSSEIKHHLPLMVASAKQLAHRHPGCQFVLPLAPNVNKAKVAAACRELNIKLTDELYPALKAADVAIAASGTVTLQATLTKTPMVIIYKGSYLSHAIAKMIVKIPDIGLCNIIAQKRIVPELVQYAATVRNIVNETDSLLTDQNKRRTMISELETAARSLRHDSIGATPLPALVQHMLK